MSVTTLSLPTRTGLFTKRFQTWKAARCLFRSEHADNRSSTKAPSAGTRRSPTTNDQAKKSGNASRIPALFVITSEVSCSSGGYLVGEIIRSEILCPSRRRSAAWRTQRGDERDLRRVPRPTQWSGGCSQWTVLPCSSAQAQANVSRTAEGGR